MKGFLSIYMERSKESSSYVSESQVVCSAPFYFNLCQILLQRSCFVSVVIYSCYFIPLLVTWNLGMYVFIYKCVYIDVYIYIQQMHQFFQCLRDSQPFSPSKPGRPLFLLLSEVQDFSFNVPL